MHLHVNVYISASKYYVCVYTYYVCVRIGTHKHVDTRRDMCLGIYTYRVHGTHVHMYTSLHICLSLSVYIYTDVNIYKHREREREKERERERSKRDTAYFGAESAEVLLMIQILHAFIHQSPRNHGNIYIYT